MTLSELIIDARSTLDDEVGESTELLWSSEELTRYLNDSVERMCRKVPSLIKDNSTASVCSISLVAGTQHYALDASILDVARVKITGVGTPLEKRTSNYLDERITDWDNTSNRALPQYYTEDYKSGYITFVYTPDQSYTATLTVHRIPISSEKLTTNTMTASPAVPAKYHADLIPWVLHRCYMKHDLQTFNEKQSVVWKQEHIDRLNRIYNEESRKKGSVHIYPAQGNL